MLKNKEMKIKINPLSAGKIFMRILSSASWCIGGLLFAEIIRIGGEEFKKINNQEEQE